MSEFKGTKGPWVIVTKGNTVQQLCIQVSDDIKVCGNISPKRVSDALLISKAPEMLEMLQMWCMDMEERGKAYGDCYTMTKQLIKSATEL